MDSNAPPADEPDHISYKLRRGADGFVGRWQRWWQGKWFRRAVYALAASLLLFALV